MNLVAITRQCVDARYWYSWYSNYVCPIAFQYCMEMAQHIIF